MRKTLIALTATAGLIGLGTIGASAAPLAPVHAPAQASAVHQADWYCGPRCEDRRHRRWEERREWRPHHNPYYGYNGGYYGNTAITATADLSEGMAPLRRPPFAE